MQVKMKEILGYLNFYEAVRDQKIPLKIAYKLAQLSKAIEAEISFYQDKLREIITEYGELDENGNPVPSESGNGIMLRKGVEEECYKAMQELEEIEVTLPDVKLTIDELEKLQLTIVEMNYMMPFLAD
jgi:hypothetical protein